MNSLGKFWVARDELAKQRGNDRPQSRKKKENPPSMLVGAGEQPVIAEPQVVQPNFQLVSNFPVLNSTAEIFIQTGIVATVDSKV